MEKGKFLKGGGGGLGLLCFAAAIVMSQSVCRIGDPVT